jgi:hypothetical protein
LETEVAIKYFPTWDRYLQEFREMELTKSQLGWLWLTMMEYQFENKVPETVPKALKMAWTYLRKDLDDARRHYETSVKNGRKGGRPKKKEPENNPEETEENLKKGTSTTTSTTTTTSMSTSMSTSIDTGSAPAASAGVCCETQSFGEFGWVKLTDKQYEKLENLMGGEELCRCIAHIDELAQSTGNRNRWKDWYLMVRRCHENRWYETRRFPTKEEIPKGASGTLGEAELEAIQRVLRCEM